LLNGISEYVKNLAYFMVLASLCAFVVPKGRTQNVINFITGIMLMLIVLKPINVLLGAEDKVDIVKNSIALEQAMTENSFEQYDNAGERAVLDTFERNCENMIKEKTGAKKVEVRAEKNENNVYISEVRVYSAKSSEAQVASLCGVETDKVKVINEWKEEYNEGD